jgi:phosphopantothenoylcysteine synthetase/decarboxylase
MKRFSLTADEIGALIAGVVVRVGGIEIYAKQSLELTRLDYIVGEYNNVEYWEDDEDDDEDDVEYWEDDEDDDEDN